MKVRVYDVLLPTTMVGAYPRQVFMQGPVFDAGVHGKEFPSYRTRELYRAAVALTVKDQEDVVTDGPSTTRTRPTGSSRSCST